MIRTITTDELESMRRGNADFMLLDVLPREHFSDDHIEGALNVPLASPDFLQVVERAAGGKSMRIVVYCAGEACDAAEQAARKLADAGYADVMTYAGGIYAWRQHGSDGDAVVRATATAHGAKVRNADSDANNGNLE